MSEQERLSQTMTRTAVLESRLDGHEDICAKRYGEIAKAFEGVQAQLAGINKAVNATSSTINTGIRRVLIGALLMLLAAGGTVLYNGWPWEHRVTQGRD